MTYLARPMSDAGAAVMMEGRWIHGKVGKRE
jgi:hypothetical protein